VSSGAPKVMEYDPFSAEFQADPFPVYRWMRDEAPVFHSRKWGWWALSRFEDVRAAVTDPETFLSFEGIDIDDTAKDQSGPGFLPDIDSPRHDQIRRIVQPQLLPNRVAEREDAVRRAVRVEEAIRIATPLQLVGLTTAREITLHGTTIPAGGRVVLVYGAANRDERRFDDPDRFDVLLRRGHLRHLRDPGARRHARPPRLGAHRRGEADRRLHDDLRLPLPDPPTRARSLATATRPAPIASPRRSGVGGGAWLTVDTRCVVVGGGPAGVMLSYLLARGGVDVVLLESRGDFDRRFRGDSIAPPVLDHLDTLGLAEPMLAELPHVRADAFVWSTPRRRYVLADYRSSSRRFPYYALVPQAAFLPWVVDRAAGYGLDVRMGARVSALIRDEHGRVTGVRYQQNGRSHRLDARLVVGCDGRSSKVRQLSRIEATELSSSIDICWISVPRRAEDPTMSGLELMTEPGHSIAVLGQGSGWQIGFTIVAGSFGELRAGGVEPLRGLLRRRVPWLGERIEQLTDVNQLTLLPIRITRTDRWSEPGLLLLGDAAHVISPVGGNGINFAIIDAAEAANQLIGPLGAASPDPAAVDAATAAVEGARRPKVERDQRMQVRVERATARRLATAADPAPPLPLRILAAIPGVARWSARRSARTLAVPDVVDEILHGVGSAAVARHNGATSLPLADGVD
jgi:2-polyprenyl-6-methoxyphenol hydroxylase-like FAD-dependent oxidoreductase